MFKPRRCARVAESIADLAVDTQRDFCAAARHRGWRATVSARADAGAQQQRGKGFSARSSRAAYRGCGVWCVEGIAGAFVGGESDLLLSHARLPRRRKAFCKMFMEDASTSAPPTDRTHFRRAPSGELSTYRKPVELRLWVSDGGSVLVQVSFMIRE